MLGTSLYFYQLTYILLYITSCQISILLTAVFGMSNSVGFCLLYPNIGLRLSGMVAEILIAHIHFVQHVQLRKPPGEITPIATEIIPRYPSEATLLPQYVQVTANSTIRLVRSPPSGNMAPGAAFFETSHPVFTIHGIHRSLTHY